MALLVVFAFLAGAGTALSPCVLPVLPALLSAGATGGKRRPLGIVTGLAITFTVTIVGLAPGVDGVGLGGSAARPIAVAALAALGIAVAVPAVGDRLEAPLSRLARFGPRGTGRGFWSGVLVGGALGFLYAPCAGPILAAVVSVSAASGHTVAVGLAYSFGSAGPLPPLPRRAPPPPRRVGPPFLVGWGVPLPGARAGGRRARRRRGGRRRRAGAAARARHGQGPPRGGDGRRARGALPVGDRRPPARRRREPHQAA